MPGCFHWNSYLGDEPATISANAVNVECLSHFAIYFITPVLSRRTFHDNVFRRAKYPKFHIRLSINDRVQPNDVEYKTCKTNVVKRRQMLYIIPTKARPVLALQRDEKRLRKTQTVLKYRHKLSNLFLLVSIISAT